MVKGERKPVSLDTRDLEVAKAKRDALMAAKDGDEINRVLGRTDRAIATLQEIDDAYRNTDWPRQKTRENNLRALWFIVRRALKRDDIGVTARTAAQIEKDPIPANALKATVFTGELVDHYQNDAVARARAAAKEQQLDVDQTEALIDQAKYSANRVLAQGRSVFANEKPFRALQLPKKSLQEFRDRDEFKIMRDLAFKPMSSAEMALFGDESKQLRARGVAGDPFALGAYLTWLVMRWLGLRNEEAEHCKPGEWIVEKTGRDGKKLHVLRITNYEYFKVKGVGSIRDLPLSPWLLEEIQTLTKGKEWLVSDHTPTDRSNITHRTVNDWMDDVYKAAIKAGKLPAGTQVRTAYDFRKQAGSALLAQGASIVEVSKWLGHRDVNTTTKWYVNLLRELPVLTELSVG